MFIDGGNPSRELPLGAAAPLARVGPRYFKG